MDLVVQSPQLADEAVRAFCNTFPHCRRVPQSASIRLLDIGTQVGPDRIEAIAAHWKCDASVVPASLDLAYFRVLALDMDSTVILNESVDELAERAGRGAEVRAITASAMRGEIADFAESLRRRVAMLAGTEEAVLQWVADNRMELSPGARELVAAARRAGLRTLLVSGGFGFFARRLQDQLGFDRVICNELQLHQSRLSGKVAGPAAWSGQLVDAQGKAAALAAVCAEVGCGTERAIAIGDGANDLEMMARAGISVAYRAKPQVRRAATYRLDHCGLDGVLQWFSAGVLR